MENPCAHKIHEGGDGKDGARVAAEQSEKREGELHLCCAALCVVSMAGSSSARCLKT